VKSRQNGERVCDSGRQAGSICDSGGLLDDWRISVRMMEDWRRIGGGCSVDDHKCRCIISVDDHMQKCGCQDV
jgi:hypothetical protein